MNVLFSLCILVLFVLSFRHTFGVYIKERTNKKIKDKLIFILLVLFNTFLFIHIFLLLTGSFENLPYPYFSLLGVVGIINNIIPIILLVVLTVKTIKHIKIYKKEKNTKNKNELLCYLLSAIALYIVLIIYWAITIYKIVNNIYLK